MLKEKHKWKITIGCAFATSKIYVLCIGIEIECD